MVSIMPSSETRREIERALGGDGMTRIAVGPIHIPAGPGLQWTIEGTVSLGPVDLAVPRERVADALKNVIKPVIELNKELRQTEVDAQREGRRTLRDCLWQDYAWMLQRMVYD